MAKHVKRGKKDSRNVIYAPDDDGKLVKVVLIPPPGRGKVSGKKMEEVIKRVRDARLKAQAALKVQAAE